MNRKKLWSAMLSLMATVIVLFALGGITVFADETDEPQSDIIASGYCGAEGNGENLSWTLDSKGLLTISGTGGMRNYYYVGTAPWNNNVDLIKAVNIDEGVTSIGDDSFFNCASLASIDIPDSVTSIGKFAFAKCTSLSSIDIPDSVTSIGECAFEGCSSLASIIIPDSVTYISNSAFSGCSSLTSITIPDSVTSISNSAFANCTSLSSITIPNSVTSIGDSAFYECTSLASIDIPNGVTSIGDNAFKYCESLTTITIPDSVTSIGDSAFKYCESLTTITIPDGVTSICNSAFYGCFSLASITIPNGVESIGNSAFYGCSSLTSITIPKGVTSIGNYAFRNCSSLTSITIPKGVTRIGDFAFAGCSLLTSIIIPNGVTSIGNSAFHGCFSLSSITIPNGVESIGNSAFKGCSSLTSITIPNSVTSIRESAFEGCKLLSAITIPNSVTGIGNKAFADCKSLTTITIPNSVTSIGDSAFYYCTSLSSIDIPDSVTIIGDWAFSGCSALTSIDVPNSATSIGKGAFEKCEKLSEIYLRFAPNNFNSDLSSVFSSSINAIVYVPSEYYEIYESLLSSYENIIVCDLDGNTSFGGGAHLYGYSLSLDGSIGVNFYMKFDAAVSEADDAYMEFTVNNKTQQVPVKEATSKDGYLVFRCDVVAKEMADEITAQVYLSKDNPIGDAYTYSVREYAAYILNHPEKYSYNAIDLVKAMLNYGAASQKYFNYKTGNLANSVLPGDEQQSSLSVGNLTYYNAGDISPEKISLSLKSTITMKLYFKTEDIADITSFEYRKNQLTTTASGDYTIVIIEGIPATNFSGIISIKCYLNESDEYKTVKIKPSNYAYIALKQPVGGVITDDLKEVVRALYQFSLAANEYNLVQPA